MEMAGFLIASIAAVKASVATPKGKLTFDQITMKVPVIGTIIIKGNLASFSRTLSTMMGAEFLWSMP